MVTATDHRAIIASACFTIMIELVYPCADILAETSFGYLLYVRSPGDHPQMINDTKSVSGDRSTNRNKFVTRRRTTFNETTRCVFALWRRAKLLPIRRTAWTRRGGIVYCALTSGTPIGTICMKSIRHFGTSIPIGSGASRVPWRSARVSYLSSETAKSPRRSSSWPYCIRPRRDGAISCTSSRANNRARGARRCLFSWGYLFFAAKSRPRCPPFATTLPPTRICRNCSYTTWLTL